MIINLDVHIQLLNLGYVHIHHEPEFDDGDAENGPGEWGHPEFDEYISDVDHIYIDHNGHFVHYELRDLECEKWLEGGG